jgi:TnpA family transposase
MLAGWGIVNAQPIVLNERQVGAAIEGVLRQEEIGIVQLAVDTHGYTDFGMAFAHGPGLDLCPRLKALKDHHLFLPRGYEVPQILKPICEASLDLRQVPIWNQWVHLIASAYSAHTSAINVLACFGSAARGDPLYEVGWSAVDCCARYSSLTISSIRHTGASCCACSIAAKPSMP